MHEKERNILTPLCYEMKPKPSQFSSPQVSVSMNTTTINTTPQRSILLPPLVTTSGGGGIPQRHLLHETDVVEFRQVAVFLEVGAFVRGHAGKEVFDEVVRDEGVAEVEFGDVGLGLG